MVRIGEKLREERIARGLTLDEVSKATKIKASFLSAIEDGLYNKLPSSTYAQGFVNNYAEYLGIPKKEARALFRREFDEEKVYKVLPQGLIREESFPRFRLRLAQTAFLGIMSIVLLIGYLLFQNRYAFINPPLDVDSPREKAVLRSLSVTVMGRTDPNATVYVQKDVVFLNPDGSFSKKIDVFEGAVTVQIRAVNRFGRETLIERHILVKQ